MSSQPTISGVPAGTVLATLGTIPDAPPGPAPEAPPPSAAPLGVVPVDPPRRIDEGLRASIMADPSLLLDDKEVMRALVAANERAMGPNVVDMRGLAMDRLESRLDRLEDTHRTVIAAAYDNLAGTNQIHRALLRLMEAPRFEGFLRDLGGDVAAILRVESIRLVLESPGGAEDPVVRRMDPVLSMETPGFVDVYVTAGRRGPPRAVTLRPVRPESPRVHGARADAVRSEAVLRLDLGAGLRPGMLVLGSGDPRHFSPGQGTDLLAFFGATFERIMRRWLA